MIENPKDIVEQVYNLTERTANVAYDHLTRIKKLQTTIDEITSKTELLSQSGNAGKCLMTDGTNAVWDNPVTLPSMRIAIAQTPSYFNRYDLPSVTKTTITIPIGMLVNINGNGYELTSPVTLNTSIVGSASTRAGKDVYLYALQPTSGTEPSFTLSLNSTVPSGYTASNSRKIGGFHCLCVDVGTISGHKLSGYVAGDILPASVWDLLHRARGTQDGMVCGRDGIWKGIYLSSWDGSKLVSAYGGTVADGTSTKKWHGELHAYQASTQKDRLLTRDEFMVDAYNSNEGTAISGATDAGTTGGHVDTAGRRMISDIGMEDCCGFMWQWTYETCGAGGSGWTESVYNSSVDDMKRGGTYGNLYRLLVGAYWVDGSSCGSRAVALDSVSSRVYAHLGGRLASEPLGVGLATGL